MKPGMVLPFFLILPTLVRLFEITNNVEWQTAEKVTDPVLRSQHIDELYEKLAALAKTKLQLNGGDVMTQTYAEITGIQDLLVDEHLAASGMFNVYDDEVLGRIREIRSPFEVNSQLDFEVAANRPAPGLGEGNSDFFD